MTKTELALNSIITDTWNNSDTDNRISSFLARHDIDEYDTELTDLIAV